MYMCAKWTVFVSVPTILRLDFGTAQGCVFPMFYDTVQEISAYFCKMLPKKMKVHKTTFTL